MDIFAKCYGFTEAKEAIAAGYYPYFIPLTDNEGTEAVLRGHRLIMCGSNNYLGLTTHPKVREAAEAAIRRYGTSCTGSRFLNGTLEMHEQLEQELAQWVGKEAALVFSTGMQTNLGAISALVGRNDVVILDKEDHASIVDGARLSWGETRRFAHNNMADLETCLAKTNNDKGKLVVVDGLFSMEGDIAPLPELVALCSKHDARLMLDDAHAMGVLGDGSGTSGDSGSSSTPGSASDAPPAPGSDQLRSGDWLLESYRLDNTTDGLVVSGTVRNRGDATASADLLVWVYADGEPLGSVTTTVTDVAAGAVVPVTMRGDAVWKAGTKRVILEATPL